MLDIKIANVQDVEKEEESSVTIGNPGFEKLTMTPIIEEHELVLCLS